MNNASKGSFLGNSSRFRLKNIRPEFSLFISYSIISVFAFVFYHPILATNSQGFVPWGSDTFGHIFRFEYLRESIAAGVFYPKIYPDWYLGIQLFRYYPPPLYYLLAGISAFFKNPIYATNVFIFLTAWFGAISCIFYKRWLGWELAIAGGILYLILPDFVRVAFSEGNLLRHFTSALFPLIVYCLLCAIEIYNPKIYLRLLAILLHITVISHPMMAAIFSAMLGLIVLTAWATKSINFKKLLSILSFVLLGILSASWWLLPSLTGGITEISAEAVIEGLPVLPLQDLLNPIIWQTNPESLYVGLTIFLIPIIALAFKFGREKKLLALTIPAFIGILLVTPILNAIYNATPFASLLWPARFLAPSSFLLLLACLWVIKNLGRNKIYISLMLLLILTLEMTSSIKLIHLNPPNTTLLKISQQAGSLSGWRQATLDQSRLGSGPSYFMSAIGKKEQVFGWAFQGASTSSLVASINESLYIGSFSYLGDRLNLLGVDDILLPTNLPYPNGLDQYFIDQGYDLVADENELLYFHRNGEPRAFIAEWDILGVGTGAQNYAYIFPQVILGGTTKIDEYSLEEIKQYKTLLLSGFAWNNKEDAETLVKEAAANGVKIIIDLTNTQPNVLAQQPEFLDVWAERILLDKKAIFVFDADQNSLYDLSPFEYQGKNWQTHVPQGLQTEVLIFDYFGQQGTVAGYNTYNGNDIWFIGLNIAYHTINTPDNEAIKLISDILGTPPFKLNTYKSIPLKNYQTSGTGNSFTYSLNQSQKILIPYAYFNNTRVLIDGIVVQAESLSNLTSFTAPAGTHSVTITTVPTGIHILGMMMSVISILILAIMSVNRKPKRS